MSLRVLSPLIALTVATPSWSRHAGGPKLLGELTLLRVLPGLAGVLVSFGLPERRAVLPGGAGTTQTLPRLRFYPCSC